MQKTVTYHSSAILYNYLLAEAARNAAEAVEHPVVKGWCVGIAKQHEFHAKRHRASLAKLESKNASTESKTVEATVPATASVQVSEPAPMEVEVDVDLSKEQKA